MYHYYISNNKSNIINIYNLLTKGEKVFIKRKIYKKTKEIKTNNTIMMVENLVVYETNIIDEYYCVEISNKCRILYNDDITLLEMNECSSDIALQIFKTISNNKEHIILFDI